MIDLTITPQGHLLVRETTAPPSEQPPSRATVAAFHESPSRGLLYLASEEPDKALPRAFDFARSIGRLYLTSLCQTAPDQPGEPIPEVPPPLVDLARAVEQAPPMTGLEYLNLDALTAWWHALDQFARSEVGQHPGGVQGYLRERHARWRFVGRVTLHLAENKRDEERPFAFLATYTHRLSEQGKPQHLPLARALQEYAGAKNQVALNRLLSPVQWAAENSELVRELLETRRLFQPLAWTPADAHRFLREIPLLEESGLAVRVPDWWKAKAPARPQVQVKIGQQPGGGLLGASSLLDFSVEVALDGQTLTKAEWKQLLATKAPLALLRGKWVEIDSARLQAVLAHWQEAERGRAAGVSFLEGMRLLAGVGSGGAGGEELAEAQTREWSQVVPGAWLEQTLAALREPSALAGFDPGRGLQARLRPYQEDGVRWLHFLTRLGLGACLADDMGLGKTIQTIALLLQLKRESTAASKPETAPPSLLVAPASLLANWKGEITRFAPGLETFFAHPSETPAAQLKDTAAIAALIQSKDLVVTTYALLARVPWLREQNWRLVILDEAQAIKNPAARQTRAVKELRAGGRIALTGTPVENRLGDLWSLFDFINPGLLGGAPEFKRLVRKLSDDAKQHFAPLRQLTGPYILRRLKTDRKIIADLPDKTEVTAWCPLSKAQAALYEQSVREMARQLADVDDESVQRRGLVLAFLMRFKQICNHPSQWLGDGGFDPGESGKFIRLRELAEEISARQEKALVFTQFREMTAPLADSLRPIFGRAGLVLHGSTPVKERRKLVEQFQQDDGPPFFVLSLKAGGTGLNLTAASHVFHFDRWWNPAVENQATDRAFRIGQKRNVLVHKFACRGTVEEKIDALIEEKKSLATQLLGADGDGENSAALLTEMPDDELLRFVSLDFQRAVQE